jgi:hypothetical protein
MDFVEVFVIFIGDLYEEWFLIEKVDRIVWNFNRASVGIELIMLLMTFWNESCLIQIIKKMDEIMVYFK